MIDRVESLGREQKQPFRVSKMLKYEWRPGQIVGDDDAYLAVEDENQDHGIIPEPVLPALPDAGPNPFAVDGPALPGAEEPNDLPEGKDMDQEEEHATAENQGAPIDEDEEAQDENQGAPNDENDENQGAPPDENKTNLNIEDEIKVEEVDEDSDDEWDDEEPESRREEKERRENYFSTNSGDDFGRGKRERTARHPSLFYRRSSLTLHKKERMIFSNMRGTSIGSQGRQICWRDTRRVLFSLK